MAKIEELRGEFPGAFAAYVTKLNEVIKEMNRRELEAGPGIKLTPSDHKTVIEVSGLTATGECNSEGGVDIEIFAQ